MKIVFGTMIPTAEALTAATGAPDPGSAFWSVPVPLLLPEGKLVTECEAFLEAGGTILAADAVAPELAANIFSQERPVKTAFVREFRALCRRLADAGIQELSAPFDVAALWRTPSLFTVMRSLLCELSGPLLENGVVCRLPLAAPQRIPAARLEEFREMLVPGAFGWLFQSDGREESARWSEPLRFYADLWSFPAGTSREQCTAFLTQAGRCAPDPCRALLPAAVEPPVSRYSEFSL